MDEIDKIMDLIISIQKSCNRINDRFDRIDDTLANINTSPDTLLAQHQDFVIVNIMLTNSKS